MDSKYNGICFQYHSAFPKNLSLDKWSKENRCVMHGLTSLFPGFTYAQINLAFLVFLILELACNIMATCRLF